jgi:chorismate mutase
MAGTTTVRAIRGATTAEANTVPAITSATLTLLKEMCSANNVTPDQIISATFSVTPDLDAMFPAQAARSLHGWQNIPLLDVQQMRVQGDLQRCIRILLYVHTALPPEELKFIYQNGAKHLRPDLLH